jgi:2-oxoglutarate dehydrogenase complex, dehydrogenase (E1) component, and related enzymes
MLRLKGASSAVDDFARGRFEPVLSDQSVADPSAVTRVLLHSGKIHYDLVAEREARGATNVALVRLEQFYPLPAEQLRTELAKYPQAELVWVQDEPENQGAWPFIAVESLGHNLPKARVVSRPASASPATGSSKRSSDELRLVLDRAFD